MQSKPAYPGQLTISEITRNLVRKEWAKLDQKEQIKIILLHPKSFGDYNEIKQQINESFDIKCPYEFFEGRILKAIARLLLQGKYIRFNKNELHKKGQENLRINLGNRIFFFEYVPSIFDEQEKSYKIFMIVDMRGQNLKK